MNIAIDESQKAPMPVYDYPPIDLLTQGKHASVAGAEAELRESSACLLDTLDSFNIEAQIIGIVRGPSVTRYELELASGVKLAKLTNLSEDIALALDASRPHVSIYEPVYGDEGEALVMDRITAEEDGTDTALDRVLLQQLMEILDSREKKIVVMRYFRDKTQSEIAAYLGISQVQVSRLENRIMEKLRERALERAQ